MTVYSVLFFFIILGSGELFATLVFWAISKMMHHDQVNRLSARGVLKGMLERTFLFFSLINGFPHSLTVFGALKIATRLKDKDDSITNDYFLIGNLISVMLSIIYYMVWKNILGNG